MKLQDCTPTSVFGLLCVMMAGCFAPTVTDDDGAGQGSSSTGGSSSAASLTGTTEADETAATTSASPTATTTGSSADESESASESTTTPDPTTGENSYCGDGTVDEGEECDDGLDANGLDQACLPDCNLNTCGDGNVGPGEACDEGADDNILSPGACAPDCSGVIQTRSIVLSDYNLAQEDGNFGPNPLAAADAMCPAGYLALIAVPGERQVTNTPNQADAIVDWPLHPYTHYVNDDDEPVWTTDSAPLLGVRDGIPQPLENAVDEVAMLGGPYPVTGMLQDWTTNTAENCSGFSSASAGLDMRLGNSSSVDQFLHNSVALSCNDTVAQVLCIEQ